MTLLHSAATAAILSAVMALPASADISVVASIKPIHSLVSGVMAGVGVPSLIVEGAGSPHTYALKPSRARALQDADVVFWVGHELELFLEKPLKSLGANAEIVALIDAPGLKLLPFREGGPGDALDDEDHADHKDEDHADHKDEYHADHKDEYHADHKDEDHAEPENHHDHGGVDPHVWLNPDNAKQIVRQISKTLLASDPANANVYRANAEGLLKRLDMLVAEMTVRLAPVAKQHFVVFHDSYHYLEDRFSLESVSSITVNPDVIPGAERVGEIQNRVRELDAVCIFAEPQFSSKLVQVIAEAGTVTTSVLDPLGSGFPDGPNLYFEMMRAMASTMRDCQVSRN
jgi:zinc transport system substrate-binding protein